MWTVVGVFVWPIVPGGIWTLVLGATLTTAPVGVLLRGWHVDAYPSAWTRVLVLRPFWYALLLMPFLVAAGILGALAGWPFSGALAGGRTAILGFGALMAVFVIWGYFGSRRLVVKHVKVTIPDLPPELEGVRIVQLSDLHIGPHTPPAHVRRIVKAVEAAEGDLLVFTGDQVDDYDRDVAHFGRAFGHLRASMGVFAIAGNHDIYAGWEGVREGMAKAGMTVLVNDAVPVTRGDATLWVAGTGDPAARQWGVTDPNAPAPDLDKTMAKIPPGAISLVLAHNPALWPGLVERGASLTLSGHTHHGQFSIPMLNWCLASPFLEFAMGMHTRAASTLYINPGTNYWGLPLRVGAWPEVSVVTLRRS